MTKAWHTTFAPLSAEYNALVKAYDAFAAKAYDLGYDVEAESEAVSPLYTGVWPKKTRLKIGLRIKRLEGRET